MWILRILGPIKFCKGPIKISNGPLKNENLHLFEWGIGHWPILRAHHHFGLGLSLLDKITFTTLSSKCCLIWQQKSHIVSPLLFQRKENILRIQSLANKTKKIPISAPSNDKGIFRNFLSCTGWKLPLIKNVSYFWFLLHGALASTLKAPITTAAGNKFWDIFPNFQQK